MSWLVALLTKPIIGAILGPIVNGFLTAQKQKLDAAGSHEARVVELGSKQLDLDIREAELNSQLLVVEQGHWFTRSIRPLMGWIVIILIAKVLVWDKALGQWTGGTTDALDPYLWWVVQTIIIAYFGGRTVDKVMSKLTQR